MNIKALYDIALNKSLVESKVKARQRKLAGEGEGRVVWRCFVNLNYEPISWPFRFKIFGLEVRSSDQSTGTSANKRIGQALRILLCGARPYVSIGWRWDICFYWF